MALTAARVQQLHALIHGKINKAVPADPPSDTEVGLSLDQILLQKPTKASGSG